MSVRIVSMPLEEERRSTHATLPEEDVTPDHGAGTNYEQFAKLVHSIQFVKKWTQKSEHIQTRQDFMEKHRYNRPRQSMDNTGWVAVSRRKKRFKFAFAPSNLYLYWWMFVVTITVIYNAVVIIARQTFTQLQGTRWSIGVWLVLDYVADIIYVVDFALQFRTGFLQHGLLETNSAKMAFHYIKSSAFKWDLLSIIPFDWLYLIPAIGVRTTIVRLNRILKLHRVVYFFDRTDSSTNWPNVFRIFTLLLYLFLIIHWNACFYFLISKAIGFGEDRWVYPMIEGVNATSDEYANFFKQYIVSLYWSTLTLTTIGEVPGPVTDTQYAFVIFDFLVGILIFATVIGMVGEIITNMSAHRTSFQSRLDTIKQYMRYRNVGKDLQKRVIKWFDYLWDNKHSLDEQEILQMLPDKLHAEIALHVNFELLSRVSVFDQCEAGFLEELVLKLKPQVFSPGDYVCRKGDIGKEMFIVKQGKLEVVDDNGFVIATLGSGSYFGEISILNLSRRGNRRTANVRSVGFSDLFSLSKMDLLEVVEEYPEARAMLEERGRNTLAKDKTLEEENEADHKSLKEEVDMNVPEKRRNILTRDNSYDEERGIRVDTPPLTEGDRIMAFPPVSSTADNEHDDIHKKLDHFERRLKQLESMVK